MSTVNTHTLLPTESDLAHSSHPHHPHVDSSAAAKAAHWFLSAALFAVLVAILAVAVANQHKINGNRGDVQAVLSALQQRSAEHAHKFLVSHVPPRKLQLGRGTCWDFGTIGPVEQIYRSQGIANGFLQPNQFVSFSEQAYGNQVVTVCSQNQQLCMFPGDMVAWNSTEGGEATLLWLLREQFSSRLLPNATCPYIDSSNSTNPLADISCPGIEQAIAQNPIRLNVTAMRSLYDVAEIKGRLRSTDRAMPISVPVHTNSYYLPCSDPNFASRKDCVSKAYQCPTSYRDQYCAKLSGAMYNMNGEFRVHHEPELEAGHVMTLVGYNDEYTTEDGLRGGFIIRNTWKDGVYSWDEFHSMNARGSHSAAFFMQSISVDDEIFLCSNPNNPRNWFKCGDAGSVNASVSQCIGTQSVREASANYMPLELKCGARDPALGCDRNETGVSYYFVSQTPYLDGLYSATFLKIDSNAGASLISPYPRPLDEFALLFEPANASYHHPREADFCGFYFLPYDVIRLTGAMFGGFFVNDYEIAFHNSAYLANAASYPQFNYTLLSRSSFTQSTVPLFDQPYAYDISPDSPPAAAPARRISRSRARRARSML